MARYPFTDIPSLPGSSMPRLPLELFIGHRSIQVSGIVDSGAALSVLPYNVGLALGAFWEQLPRLGPLAGGMAGIETRALAAECRIGGLSETSAVVLHFAWAHVDAVPLLLGPADFLSKFNVCLYRSENFFEVWLA